MQFWFKFSKAYLEHTIDNKSEGIIRSKKFQTDSVNHKLCNKYKLADSQVCMLIKMINSSGDMIISGMNMIFKEFNYCRNNQDWWSRKL